MRRADLDVFSELGIGAGWRAGTVLAMLWVYCDESGEHDRETSVLKRLTLGCAIAKFDAWQSLTGKWNAVLAKADLPFLHMADFEARQPPFHKLDDDERKALLGSLIEIASAHVPMFMGFNDLVRPIRTKAQFREAYGNNVAKFLKELYQEKEPLESDEMTVLFARHKDISAEMMGRYFDFFSYWLKDRVQLGGFGNPETLAPLQVADLAAYEFSRTAREFRPPKERYPLVTLAETAQRFTLYNSSWLGRDRLFAGRKPPKT